MFFSINFNVLTFAYFARPLLATILCVWEIWSGSNNHAYTMHHVFHWLAKKCVAPHCIWSWPLTRNRRLFFSGLIPSKCDTNIWSIIMVLIIIFCYDVHVVFLSNIFMFYMRRKTQTAPNPPNSSKGHFFEKNQHCWKLVLSLLQMEQNYYLARSTGQKCWKINKNAFWREGHVSKSALEDFAGFRKVSSQNT